MFIILIIVLLLDEKETRLDLKNDKNFKINS